MSVDDPGDDTMRKRVAYEAGKHVPESSSEVERLRIYEAFGQDHGHERCVARIHELERGIQEHRKVYMDTHLSRELGAAADMRLWSLVPEDNTDPNYDLHHGEWCPLRFERDGQCTCDYETGVAGDEGSVWVRREEADSE